MQYRWSRYRCSPSTCSESPLSWLCHFCGENENISQPFFACPLVRYISNAASYAFGLKNRPNSIQHLFASWLRKFRKKDKYVALVGIAEVLWGLWKTRNNVCFRSVRPNDPVVVTNLIGRKISSWAILRVKEENRDGLNWGVKLFMQLSSEAFQEARGWRPIIQRLTG
jgi:hypothetical protein